MTRSSQMIESLPNPERFREVRSSQPGYTRTLIDVTGGTRMTREKNSQNHNDSRGDDSHIWGTVGVVVGGVLAFKVLSAMGVRENEDLTLVEITTTVALLFGPVYVLTTAGKHLRKDVEVGKSTNATYWTTMAGLSISALTLAGVTSIDDLIGLIK